MHPHITTVFEVFEEDGVPWLVMELIDGASLRSMLSDGDPLPCEEVMRHAEGLTDALRDHEVNRARRENGLQPATMLWLWGLGRAPRRWDWWTAACA